MKPLKLASILMIPVAGTLCGYGTATAAANGNSAAAHGCLQGPQLVFVGGGITKIHFIEFANHGDCTSFFAMNKDLTLISAEPLP